MAPADVLPFAERKLPDTICLFDVDGTLTPARLHVSDEMRALLAELRKTCAIGYVGGSDLVKQKEQLGADVIDQFDFCFPENGLSAYKFGETLASQSFIGWIGEEKYDRLVVFILKYLASIKLPKRRGTFIEFRNGMINVSPIGRNASTAERKEYEAYDIEHKIREKMVEALKKEFPDYGLTYSIGGQISFDVFPAGWDKTFCLRYVVPEGFTNIHFFGDKSFKGGNDYEIYSDERTIGHAVDSPDDTIRILKDLFFN